MNYQQLKDFVNNLNPEQLQEPVLAVSKSDIIRIIGAEILQEDLFNTPSGPFKASDYFNPVIYPEYSSIFEIEQLANKGEVLLYFSKPGEPEFLDFSL